MPRVSDRDTDESAARLAAIDEYLEMFALPAPRPVQRVRKDRR